MPPRPKRRPRGRPTREEQPLSRERILQTAIALVDRDGLEKLSLRGLALALGVSAMSLYHHLPGKEALWDAISEAIFDDVAIPSFSGRSSWRSAMVALATSLRAGLRRHPHALPLVATRPVRSTAVLTSFDALLGVLRSAGFEARESIYLVDAVTVLVVGHAFAEYGTSIAARPDRDGTDLPSEALRSAAFTHLADAIDALGAHDYDAEFTMALSALLDGFGQRLAHRAQER